MDILHLIDRLEELFNESRAFLWSKKVLVDEERMLDLIDQMRLAIPEEIKQSQKIINQKELVIAKAHEEARRTIELAKEQCEKLVEKDAIVQKAELFAEDIQQRAKDETNIIKQEADVYAIESLEHLEIELAKIITQVRNGIIALKSEDTTISQNERIYQPNPVNPDKAQS